MNYLILIISILFASAALAKPAVKKNNSNLKREFSFSDMSIVGNYKKSFGANVIVENEKNLDDLLGVRKHFKDRVKAEAKRKSL